MISQSTSDKRRRDKTVLSCTFCRGRKIRCDRQSPCNACLRRGKPEECSYPSSEQQRKDAIDYRPHVRSQGARQRIARLEKLVTEMRDMMQRSGQQLEGSDQAFIDPVPSLPPPDAQATENMGKLSLTGDHAVYMGSSHWATILEDIQQLKDELSDDDSDSVVTQESTPFNGSLGTRISLLTGVSCLPREQIMAMIPARKVVDRHISQFFNAFDLAPVILHRNKFLAEYANFWKNPSAAPIMWVGLLFSMMSTSAFLQQQEAEALGLSNVDSRTTLETYRTLTIHCLVAGDYLRPSRYTIETLTLHFAVDQNVNMDTNIENWVLIGVVIRIALRMGLHRDPSHWPNIRPLQAELRRRIWIALYQMDYFTSTQIGLPRIIKDSQCDTRPPAHLFDNDIGFEHDEIPPERPLTDHSPLLHIIQRNPIIKVSAEIYDAAEVAPPTSATVAMLSARLQKAIDALPKWLKYKPLETAVADNPVTILNRMFLDILIQKAIYLLHRHSFVKGSTGEESIKSNDICIQSALAILEHQRRMSEETQPGGLMFSIRWKVASSLSHEFLQATMMLCFALSRITDGDAGMSNSCPLHRRDDIVEALTSAKGLWEKNADRSVEAQKAAKAITKVLKQDLDKSSISAWTSSGGLFDQGLGIAPQSHLGSFDCGQDMALDLALFTVNDEIAPFGNMLDDFVSIEGVWREDISLDEFDPAPNAVEDAGRIKRDS